MKKSRFIKPKEFFRKLHHNKWVRKFIHALLVIGVPGLGAYMHWIAPKKVSLSKHQIPIKNLPKPFENFRIVQISDIHYGPTNDSAPYIREVVEKINALKPDIVVLTGDFLQWDERYIHSLAGLLGKIESKHGTFACLGNHDYGVCHPRQPATDPIDHTNIIAALAKTGITTLHNQRQSLNRKNQNLIIAGVGDFWTEHFRPADTLTESSDQPVILLCHNPDAVDHLQEYHYDLMLCGHVHGGQISFPWIGPLTVPVKNRHLRRGLHKVKEKWIHVNRGLGFIFKARLLSAPEITLIELV